MCYDTGFLHRILLRIIRKLLTAHKLHYRSDHELKHVFNANNVRIAFDKI